MTQDLDNGWVGAFSGYRELHTHPGVSGVSFARLWFRFGFLRLMRRDETIDGWMGGCERQRDGKDDDDDG